MAVIEAIGPATELGVSLVDLRRDLDRSEAEWLAWLAEFDRRCLWRLDGHVCATSWLVPHPTLG